LDLETIVETAVRLSDEVGPEHLTLGSIAAKVGVKPPSLYEHVAGLPGVQRALRLRGFETLGDVLRRATVGVSGDAAIRALAAELRRFVRSHPGLYQATIRTTVGDTPEIRAAGEEVLGILYAVLAGYGIRNREAVHAARYLRSVLHGFVSLESAGGFGLPVDLDESYGRMVQVVVRELRRWPNRPGRGGLERGPPGARNR
jgi:AcrR family transcriptional regulator